MIEFLHFEKKLLEDQFDIVTVHEWVLGGTEEIKLNSKQLELELNFYLNNVKKNFKFYSEVQNIIHEEVFLKTKRTYADEYCTFYSMERILTDVLLLKFSGKIVSQLLSIWITNTMADFNETDESFDSNKIYKNRYFVLNRLLFLMKQFETSIGLKHNVEIQIGEKLRDDFFKIMQILVNKEVIGVYNKQFKKTTEVYYVSTFVLDNQNFLQNLKIFINKPTLTFKSETIIIGEHYSSIQFVVHNNQKSKKKLVLTDMSYLIKQNNLKYYINWDIYHEIKNLILNEYTALPIENEKELFLRLRLFKVHRWLKHIDKKLSKLYVILIFLQLAKYEKILKNGFYLGYFLDFRGRVYSDSPISPVGNKLFRYLYCYGSYSKKEINQFKKNNKSADLGCLNKIIRKTNFKKIYPQINVNDVYQAYCIETGFFEIGKIFKTKFLDKYRGKLSKINFIDIGILKFNEFFENKVTDFDDKLELLYILNIFEQNQKGNFLKFIVYKDATASAIQLLLLVLDSNTFFTYYNCNFLSSSHWYDTYFFIINKFVKTFLKKNTTLVPYFTRSRLKKTIMTYNYEATLWRCWSNFKNDVETKVPDLNQMFNAFYFYLEDLFENTQYYKKPSNEIITFYRKKYTEEKKIEYTTVDELKIGLEYFQSNKTRIQKKIKGKRETIIWNDYTEILDEIKTFRALRANIIHSLDGTLVRQITAKLPNPIITIHDSYGIDILGIENLTIIACQEYSHLHENHNVLGSRPSNNIKISSIFILL